MLSRALWTPKIQISFTRVWTKEIQGTLDVILPLLWTPKTAKKVLGVFHDKCEVLLSSV